MVVSVSDVSTLLVEGSGLVRQPPGDMVIVTKDLIVYTDYEIGRASCRERV